MNTGVVLFWKALICVKESSDESNVFGIVSVYMGTSVRWWHNQYSSVSVDEVLKFIRGGGGKSLHAMYWQKKDLLKLC